MKSSPVPRRHLLDYLIPRSDVHITSNHTIPQQPATVHRRLVKPSARQQCHNQVRSGIYAVVEEIMRDPEMRGAREKMVSDQWPANGLESVKECPVCGSTRRRVLYGGLRDNVFFCAPGDWVLHDCLDCRSAYLDPRPSAATLHLAYRTYYTHEKQEPISASSLRGLRFVRRVLANGYKNWRFGARLKPSNWLGAPLFFLLPSQRTVIDRKRISPSS